MWSIIKRRGWERIDARMLLCVFVVLLTAGIWGATLLQLRQARDGAIADAEREVRGLARVFDEHAVRTIEAADQAVTYLRHRYNTVGATLDIVRDLRQGLNPGNLYNLFTVVDAHGNMVLSSQPFKPTNLSDREHFRVHALQDTGTLFISKPVLGRVSKKWSIQMTRRINHADGAFKGVVVVSMDPFYFTRLYDEVDLGQRSSIAMIGTDGVVRARRVGSVDSVGQDIGDSALFALMQGRARGSFVERSPVDGVLRYYAFEKMADYPLYMLVGLDSTSVLADYISRRKQSLLLAGISSAVIMLFCGALIVLIGRLIASRQRAIEANLAKSRFLSNMSHELRTPLNGILGFSELLLEQLDQPGQIECAEAVVASGRRLLGMIEAVLELSALESGSRQLVIALSALGAMLEQALAPHRAQAAAKDMALALALQRRSAGAVAMPIAAKLVRVLDILLDNAVGFTQAGHVTLQGGRRGRRLPLRSGRQRPGHRCRITSRYLRQIFPGRRCAEPRPLGGRPGAGHRRPAGRADEQRHHLAIGAGQGVGLRPAPAARTGGRRRDKKRLKVKPRLAPLHAFEQHYRPESERCHC